MEVKGAAPLYTLATLAVTFAGFAALLVILRQSAGCALSVLDRFLTRTVVSHLSIVAAGALDTPLRSTPSALPANFLTLAFAFVIGLEVILRQRAKS